MQDKSDDTPSGFDDQNHHQQAESMLTAEQLQFAEVVGDILAERFHKEHSTSRRAKSNR
jgi:hypothetical protein